MLERHDGPSAAQPARDSFVTARSVADLVRFPQSRGPIHRERNPRNRRERLTPLTEEGREPPARHAGPVRELEERRGRDLTDRQADQFRPALAQAWQALS